MGLSSGRLLPGAGSSLGVHTPAQSAELAPSQSELIMMYLQLPSWLAAELAGLLAENSHIKPPSQSEQ